MKNKICICTWFMLSLFVGGVYAQDGSYTAERRACLVKVLDVINDYERYSKLDNQDAVEGFTALFRSKETKIYNDLLGLSSAETLPVSEYAKLKRQETQVTTVIIKNVSKKSIEKSGGNWKVSCTFDKEMSYTTRCGVFLSSSSFYNADYKMVMELVYDPSSETCLIEKLSGSIKSDAKMPDQYFVVLKDENIDGMDVRYGSEKLTYNAYDQAIVPGEFNPSKLSSKDPDVKVVPQINNDCNQLVNLRCEVRRMRIGGYYNMGVGDALALDGQDNAIAFKTSSNSYGLKFGYMLPGKSNFKIGTFVGLGIENYTIDMDFSSNDYQFRSSDDVDKDSYLRRYHNLALSQKASLVNLALPVYADLSYSMNRYLYIYLNLGVQANYNISAKINSTEGSATVDGLYEQYQNLVLDDLWGYNGFGSYNYSNDYLDNHNIIDVNKFTVNVLGGAGIRFNMPLIPLALEVGFNYNMGIMNLLSENANRVLASPQIRDNALVYNTIDNLSSTEHVRNLTESLSSAKVKSLKLHVGLIYKF